MRYKNNKIRTDRDNIRYYNLTIVPNIQIQDTAIFVFPLYGDRFDTFA